MSRERDLPTTRRRWLATVAAAQRARAIRARRPSRARPGAILEPFTDPERYPLQAELFEDPPKIAEGMLTLKEAPGLGLKFSEKALAKFGERIL